MRSSIEIKTHSIKYDQRKNVFGTDDIIPLWIADMDFSVEAIKGRAPHEIYGYTFVTDSFYESVQYIRNSKTCDTTLKLE
jgi:bifunctional pyridoxal-dependent enzyme with beta-cystathionase and maltose regulon repressor activities